MNESIASVQPTTSTARHGAAAGAAGSESVGRDTISLDRFEAGSDVQSHTVFRQSGATLKLILDQMPAVVWTTDLHLVFTSRVGGRTALRIPDDQLIGRTVDDFGCEASIAAHRGALGGTFSAFEYFNEGHTFDCFVGPLRRPDGVVAGCAGVAFDVSSRTRGEKLLANQGRVLELIAAGAPLAEVLSALARQVEDASPNTRCAIFICDGDHPAARCAAAPSLSETVLAALNEIAISTTAVPLSAAARMGFPSVRTAPIQSRTGSTLGILIALGLRPEAMAVHDARLVETASHLAAIAIERQREEQALRTSEQRLRSIIETTPECVVLVSESGELLEFNPAGLEVVEADAAETLVGHPVLHLVAPEHRAAVRTFHQAVCRGSRANLEFDVIGLRGHRRTLETRAAPLIDPATGATMLLAVARDVSERKHVEQAILKARHDLEERVRVRTAELRQRTAELEAVNAALREEVTERKRAEEALMLVASIVESSTDAIVGAGLDGMITSWNAAAEKVFGYAATEVVGRSIWILESPKRQGEISQTLEKIRKGDAVEPFDTVRVRKDGRWIDVSLAISPVHDPSGAVVGASVISRDITDRKRLEREVLRISERERRRIGQDLHDGLGQHLAGIAYLVKALERRLAKECPVESMEVRRIGELVTQAIGQSRDLSKGLHPVEPGPDGLMASLHELAGQVEGMFHVGCEFRCDEPVPVTDAAVATHLYRIAQEAVSNAVRHGAGNRTTIRLAEHDGRVVLAVRDNGVGIPERTDGAGMGMRVMAHRAQTVGGTLSIRRGARGGTRVVCSVPRRNCSAGADGDANE